MICIFVFLSFCVSASAITAYFISSSGNDHNDGTRAKPFRSIQKLNSLKLKSNTKVFLEGSHVFSGPLILQAGEAGSRDQMITITSYGKGVATIDGGLKEAIIISGTCVEVSNMHLTGAGRKDGNTTNGVFIKNAGWSRISNITVEGFQKSGIEVSNCHHILLEKITAINNGFCGIYISGIKTTSTNITIRNCKADNNPGDPTNFANHSGNGIFAAGSDSVLIEYCTATNNGWDMPRKGNGPVGIWAYDCDHLTIQYCISYQNKTQAGASDGGGFDFDGGVTNSVMQYCLSYENQGSGYGLFQFNGASLWANNTVRYCISINDGLTTPGTAGILVWNESTDSIGLDNCKIYNNVVYNNKRPAVRFDYKSVNTKFVFANNIFVGSDEIISGPSSGEKFAGNIWWNIPGSRITFRGYKDLDTWCNETGQESINGTLIGKQVSPLFKGPITTDLTDPYRLASLEGFQLQSASVLRNEGVDLFKLLHVINAGKDFFGKEVPRGKTTPGVSQLIK